MDPDPITVCDPLPRLHLARRVGERWRLWRKRRRWVRELKNAAATDRLERLTEDIGVTRAELDRLIDGPADAGSQFETLAAMAQVDLRAQDPAVLREAMWKCAGCDCRAACKRWLATGEWRDGIDTRCPNAALLLHR